MKYSFLAFAALALMSATLAIPVAEEDGEPAILRDIDAHKSGTICTFSPGDGTGGSETVLGSTANEQACAELVVSAHPTANGATWGPGNKKCYAEFGMTGQNGNRAWRTCKLPIRSPVSHSDASQPVDLDVCKAYHLRAFVNGMTTGKKECTDLMNEPDNFELRCPCFNKISRSDAKKHLSCYYNEDDKTTGSLNTIFSLWQACAGFTSEYRLRPYISKTSGKIYPGYKYCSKWKRHGVKTIEPNLAACQARCNGCWGLTYYAANGLATSRQCFVYKTKKDCGRLYQFWDRECGRGRCNRGFTYTRIKKITTSTLLPWEQCAPTTIEGCRLAAEQNGLKLGVNIGYYRYSGCYAYNQGHWKGHVFFGTKGTEKQMQVQVPNSWAYRVKLSCNTKIEKKCAPTTQHGCRVAAKELKYTKPIKVGHYSYSGCYQYNTGAYKGQVFFGTKGTEQDMKDPVPNSHLGRVERSCKKLEKQCAPTTIEGCRLAAEQHGLKLGRNIGYYRHSGCFAYNQGSYKGQAFFGTKGTEKQMQVPVPNSWLYRVKLSCNTKIEKKCAPTTLEACRKAAKQAGLTIGGTGAYTYKGCYAYNQGSYPGKVFFGTHGSKQQMTDPVPNSWLYRIEGSCA